MPPTWVDAFAAVPAPQTLPPAVAAAAIVRPVALAGGKKKGGKRIKDALELPELPALPFLCSRQQILTGIKRSRDLKAYGLLPAEVAYMQMDLVFKTPGWLKMHDWLVLAGPIMKYLLQDCFHLAQRHVLFNYIDVLSRLWSRTVSDSSSAQLSIDTKAALADMEAMFPAWELDLNRHMVSHVADSSPDSGPSWALTSFPYERFWKRCVSRLLDIVYTMGDGVMSLSFVLNPRMFGNNLAG